MLKSQTEWLWSKGRVIYILVTKWERSLHFQIFHCYNTFLSRKRTQWALGVSVCWVKPIDKTNDTGSSWCRHSTHRDSHNMFSDIVAVFHFRLCWILFFYLFILEFSFFVILVLILHNGVPCLWSNTAVIGSRSLPLNPKGIKHTRKWKKKKYCISFVHLYNCAGTLNNTYISVLISLAQMLQRIAALWWPDVERIQLTFH